MLREIPLTVDGVKEAMSGCKTLDISDNRQMTVVSCEFEADRGVLTLHLSCAGSVGRPTNNSAGIPPLEKILFPTRIEEIELPGKIRAVRILSLQDPRIYVLH